MISLNWISSLQKTYKDSTNTSILDHEVIDLLAGFLEIKKDRAGIIALTLLCAGRRSGVNLSTLLEKTTHHLSYDELLNAFTELVATGYLEIRTEDCFDTPVEIFLSHHLEVSLRSGKKMMPGKQLLSNDNEEQELLYLYARAVCFLNRYMSVSEWILHCLRFIRTSNHPLAKKIKEASADRLSKSAGMLACLLISMDRKIVSVRRLSDVFSFNKVEAERLYQCWSAESSPLLKTGGLKLDFSPMGRKVLMADPQLTKNNGSLLSGSVEEESAPPPSTLTLIKANDIPAKELFYNSDLLQETNNLFQLLKPDNFLTYSRSMQEKQGQSGITILLSGLPGTGKTELAKQLARTAGRDLLMFEVSEQREMFYGESEKKIKKLFDYYTSRTAHPETAPVLCFNEADSIFQRRSQTGSQSQTENVIQTILLNELEKFNGILICTTNVSEMFDPAFSRRFLYHLQIGMPEEDVRVRLLLHFFPGFSSNIAKVFAKKYYFSAAQLVNFGRKRDINMIINPSQSPLEAELEEFLRSEVSTNFSTKRGVIGFNR